MTLRAKSMACLAGVNDPFRKADTLLTALAGWHVCAETIRKCCHQGAADARERREELIGLPDQFEQAKGQDREAHIDAGKVNTPDGWRDIKLVVFTSRERGESSTSADYEQRDLPSPSVRSVIAEVEECKAFGTRCKAEAERLGVVDTSAPKAEGLGVGTSAPKVGRLSVLGDGADWIWNLADVQFTGAAQLLDVFHGVEKLADAGREAFGRGTVEMEAWLAEARENLVADGYVGVCEALMRPAAGEAEGVEAGVGKDEREQPREMMGGEVAAAVLNYFCGHQTRLGYAGRLHEGRVIGSGLVEGTIKQRVNVRMKRGSARWLPEHAGPFVELMAMADTVEWSEFWALMAL